MTADQARTRGYLDIPGITLADGVTPDPMPFAHDEWFGWYARVLSHRIRVQQQCTQPGAKGAQARAVQKALCQQPHGLGTLYWVNTFCSIAEPRGDGAAVSRVMPWITWPRQAELFLTTAEMMQTPGPSTPTPSPLASMAVEKTRSCGFSWCDLADHAHRWLFEPFYTGLLISQTEDDVDKPNTPKSLMWKLDFILGRHLRKMGNRYPSWLLPAGFDWDRAPGKLRTHLNLTNPETGGVISGTSSTDRAGRGDRQRKVTIDEAAHYEWFDDVWNLLAPVTDHRVAGSSAGMHPPGFYNLVHGKNGYTTPRRFRYEWHQIPGHDDDWLDGMRQSMKHEDYEREILIRYKAGSGKNVYPEASEVATGWYPYEPGIGPLVGSIDDGKDDGTALVIWQRESGTPFVRVVGAHYVAGYLIHQIGCLMTGELDNSRRWTKRDISFAHWAARIGLSKARWVGDRHGNQTNQVTGTSPFEEITKAFGIYIATADRPEDNALEYRRDCLKGVIPYLHVHEDNGAPDFLEAVQDSHFPKRAGNVQPTSEQAKPVHDEGSHYVTSGEYYAIHYPVHRAQPKRGPLTQNIGDQPQLPSNGRYSRRPAVQLPSHWSPEQVMGARR